MLPTLYEGPQGLGVHPYGLFIMLAFAAAFLVTHTKAGDAGINPTRLVPVYLAATVGGLLGGRVLFSLAVDPGLSGLIADPAQIVQGSGFAFLGGLIGGAIAVAAIAIPMGIPPWKLADIAAPSVAIGYGIGRLGCFFAGCCHGTIAPVGPDPIALLGESSPLHGQIRLSGVWPFLTLEFHEGVGSILGQPLYPTQLWEAGGGLLMAALMLALWSRRRFDGQLAVFYLLAYPVIRSFSEAFRSDERGYAWTFHVSERIAAMFPGMAQAGATHDGSVFGVTVSQGLGLGMVLLGLLIYAARRNAGVAEEIAFDPDAELDALA